MVPVTTYALGFDPSLSWQYFLAFGALPLLLAVPATLQVMLLWVVLTGEIFAYEDGWRLAERAGLVAIVTAISVAAFWLISTYAHAPATGFETLRLAMASPFVGGLAAAAALAVGAALVAICRELFVPVSWRDSGQTSDE